MSVDGKLAATTDPLTDVGRLQEIADLGLLADEADEVLQATAREAAEELGLPIGLVSIVLDRAQYLAGMHGVEGWIAEAGGTPVEWSFCRNAVRTQSDFIVEDAHVHELVKDNPLVTIDGIRCYAGIPLTTSRATPLGPFA